MTVMATASTGHHTGAGGSPIKPEKKIFPSLTHAGLIRPSQSAAPVYRPHLFEPHLFKPSFQASYFR
jgi:hypothetical protein